MTSRDMAIAIRSVLGPVFTDSANNAAAYNKQVIIGPAEVYDVTLFATATGAGTFQLIDATASGTGTDTVLWQTNVILQQIVGNFSRPLKFTKGLQISYTATAATTLASNVSWAPGVNRNVGI